jgi:hypothetical protein
VEAPGSAFHGNRGIEDLGAATPPGNPHPCISTRSFTAAYSLANLSARRSMNGRSCQAHVVSSTSGLLHTVQRPAAASMAW